MCRAGSSSALMCRELFTSPDRVESPCSSMRSLRQRTAATRAMALLLTPTVSRPQAATEVAMAVLLLPAVAGPASGR